MTMADATARAPLDHFQYAKIEQKMPTSITPLLNIESTLNKNRTQKTFSRKMDIQLACRK